MLTKLMSSHAPCGASWASWADADRVLRPSTAQARMKVRIGKRLTFSVVVVYGSLLHLQKDCCEDYGGTGQHHQTLQLRASRRCALRSDPVHNFQLARLPPVM